VAKKIVSSRRKSAVQAEIRQSRPFRSVAQEATIALLRTASVVSRALGRVVEPSGLSLAQYNALRIVRGAGAGGIPTLAIRERMIEEGTTITRLLDKLEYAGYIRRERSFPDRRQVICYATDNGKALLDRLDPLVDASDTEAMMGLSDERLELLVELLDEVRANNTARGAARTASREAGSP
jgi:MarR family transcriptional regulator, organic hydroperoxide resistance regulator